MSEQRLQDALADTLAQQIGRAAVLRSLVEARLDAGRGAGRLPHPSQAGLRPRSCRPPASAAVGQGEERCARETRVARNVLGDPFGEFIGDREALHLAVLCDTDRQPARVTRRVVRGAQASGFRRAQPEQGQRQEDAAGRLGDRLEHLPLCVRGEQPRCMLAHGRPGDRGTTVISPIFRSQPRKALIAATTFHLLVAESFRSAASQATHSSSVA